jgi:hypothetical protein
MVCSDCWNILDSGLIKFSPLYITFALLACMNATVLDVPFATTLFLWCCACFATHVWPLVLRSQVATTKQRPPPWCQTAKCAARLQGINNPPVSSLSSVSVPLPTLLHVGERTVSCFEHCNSKDGAKPRAQLVFLFSGTKCWWQCWWWWRRRLGGPRIRQRR